MKLRRHRFEDCIDYHPCAMRTDYLDDRINFEGMLKMTEEERMEFWGELVEPIARMYGAMLLDGKHEWITIVQAMQDKAEILKKASEK